MPPPLAFRAAPLQRLLDRIASVIRRRLGAAALSLAVIPAPLTEIQQAELLGARDHLPHHDSACRALVENLREWSAGRPALSDPSPADGAHEAPHAVPLEEIRLLTPDLADELLANPDANRGCIVRIAGRLEQSATLDSSAGPLDEWFIRLEDGSPVLVLLASSGPLAETAGPLRENGAVRLLPPRPSPGETVSVVARWYKPISAEARDRRVRAYPAFVGRWIPDSAAAARSAQAPGNRLGVSSLGALLIILVILLMAVTIAARLLGRRSRPRVASPFPVKSAMMGRGDAPGLPEDPADALAVLHQRHST